MYFMPFNHNKPKTIKKTSSSFVNFKKNGPFLLFADKKNSTYVTRKIFLRMKLAASSTYDLACQSAVYELQYLYVGNVGIFASCLLNLTVIIIFYNIYVLYICPDLELDFKKCNLLGAYLFFILIMSCDLVSMLCRINKWLLQVS